MKLQPRLKAARISCNASTCTEPWTSPSCVLSWQSARPLRSSQATALESPSSCSHPPRDRAAASAALAVRARATLHAPSHVLGAQLSDALCSAGELLAVLRPRCPFACAALAALSAARLQRCTSFARAEGMCAAAAVVRLVEKHRLRLAGAGAWALCSVFAFARLSWM